MFWKKKREVKNLPKDVSQLKKSHETTGRPITLLVNESCTDWLETVKLYYEYLLPSPEPILLPL